MRPRLKYTKPLKTEPRSDRSKKIQRIDKPLEMLVTGVQVFLFIDEDFLFVTECQCRKNYHQKKNSSKRLFTEIVALRCTPLYNLHLLQQNIYTNFFSSLR